jgi:tRNA(Ile)-lysidine synthase
VRALADAWSALAPGWVKAAGEAASPAPALGPVSVDGRPAVWAVACSGGRDSMALLHAAAGLACELAQQGASIEVVALHVHHGLSLHADAWADQVLRCAADLAGRGVRVRAVVQRVQVMAEAGDSLEAQARLARHQALQAMAQASGAAVLWLAHHQRDQAETFLLQALRGGGVNGLAAMPAAQVRDGVCWARPWLGMAATEVAAYVSRHAIRHIEDDSNADVRWARNRLRHQAWPELSRAFPQAESALAMAAARVADALPVLQAWLAQAQAQDQMCGAQWPVAAWAQRPVNERRLLLSQWYREVSGRALPASWVTRLASEWPKLALRGQPWREPALGLALYRGQVSWLPEVGGLASALDQREVSGPVLSLKVDGPGVFDLPGWGLALRVQAASSGGVPATGGIVWRVQARSGGEQWLAHGAGVPRALKKQFQSMGVPPWARQGPLIWRGESLAWVPGLGVDARCREVDGVPQWALSLVRPNGV